MEEPVLTPFKMFGLQRSGTNLMVALMRRNFQSHSMEHGAEWKHGPVHEPNRAWNGQLSKFVLCVKNPYAWLPSCYRYFQRSHNADRTVARQFKANPGMTFEEFVTTPTYDFATPVDRWNGMNRLWLQQLPADRTVVVRHEDQLRDQSSVLQTVQDKLGLARKGEQLRGIRRRVGVGAVLRGPMNFEYYRSGGYLENYTPELLDRVTRSLDDVLMSKLGYNKSVPGAPAGELWQREFDFVS